MLRFVFPKATLAALMKTVWKNGRREATGYCLNPEVRLREIMHMHAGG